MPQQITNRVIFDELKDLRLEMKADMNEIKKDVDENTDFRNQLVGKMTVVFAVIGLGINIAYDWIRDKLTV